MINPIQAVGKDNTAFIGVEVKNNNNNTPITLTLTRTQGTGEARFVQSNGATLPITQNSTVEIKGITESSTKDNIRIEAKIGNRVQQSKDDFSVLLVELSLRTSGSVSNDNNGLSVYRDVIVGSTNLGRVFTSAEPPLAWAHGVEIVGTVKPSNYTGNITLQREVVISRTYRNQTLIPSQNYDNFPDTTSNPNLRDDNPQSNNSGGKVYDLDAPSLGLDSSTPIGVVVRRRINFRQWATVINNESKYIVSTADLQWYQRISIIRGQGGDEILDDVFGDNKVATGTTMVSWDLE